MAQTTLIRYNNKNLFSNYYLDNKVKTSAEWTKNDHIAAFSEIKKLYDEERKSFENFNEAQLIDHFLEPIFKILLFEPEPEEAAGSEFPDFAFFKDKNSRAEAHKNKETISFYTNVLAIGEAKKWDTELDGKPLHQIRNYLDITDKKWGILTNGRKWRLFYKEKKRDEYYEIDLPSLLDSNDIEGFKYFFYFFRRDAFLLPEIFLETVLRESEVHAKSIGDNLKENVYRAMKKIAEGFFGRPQNNLDRNDEAARELVQKNTMLLLYRLLFLLYAEDRKLLDIENAKYLTNHSFRRIKQEVKDKRGRTEQGYDYSGTTIWDRLKSLFELINVGSNAIGEKEFHVPAYNGGLFDTKKNPELDEKWKIGDKYLAEAIHLLTWSEINGAGFVDYSELEIRHLGSIYEGLLEYKLKVAELDKVTKENEWVALEKYNEGRKQQKAFEDFDEFSRAKKGELYLATDKGERKATGSYYTPDYIVNYIVRNTIEPVVAEKWKEAQEKNKSFVDAALSVKVLDPAMGSGHFLVGAVDFLADKLLSAAQKDIEAKRLADEPRFSDIDWARREVVAHCIYGVDLNPMAVELAKVSLWLKTISREKPLSFLDHRLKQGNSLIGARLEKLHKYPDLKAKKEEKKGKDAAQQTFEVEIERPFFDKIVKILNSLTDINDDSIENIHRKKDIFEKLISSSEYRRIKALANLHTAVYFGVVTTKVDKEPKYGYNDILWALRDNEEEWRKKTNREWFGKARKLAEEKSFFHWELEFPEIFFEGGAPKENPGWDAVVGNPPYVRQEQLGPNKEYFKLNYKTYNGVADLYVYFFERGHQMLQKGGKFGFISSNKFTRTNYGAALRQFLKTNYYLERLIDFGDLQVFSDATTYACIVITRNELQGNRKTLYAQIKTLNFNSLDNLVKDVGTELSDSVFEGSNWSLADVNEQGILNKISSIGLSLESYVNGEVCRGVVSGSGDAFFIDLSTRNKLINQDSKSAEIIKPLILGKDLHRYEIDSEERYLIFTRRGIDIDQYPAVKQYLEKYRETLEPRPLNWNENIQGKWHGRKPGIYKWYEIQDTVAYFSNFEKPKIIYLVFQVKPAFYLDENNLYPNNAIWIIPKNDKFLVSILNSKLGWFLISKYCPQIRNGYQLIWDNLKNIPIRRISFTTPPARRAALVDEAKVLYTEFLGASSGTAPNSIKILDFVGARLEAKPEESDVVHDLLAHLAERMIEMNNEKNAEINGFLRWLEGEIGAPVEELANKTALKEYHAHDFEAFAGALVKNRKKLKEGYDPTRREPKDKLRDEYNASVGKLAPLMRRIKATDGLIDAIVYRLYGLTEDEIKIVEESISGGKDAKE